MTAAPETRRPRPENWLGAAFALVLRVVLAVALLYVLYRVEFIIIVVLMAAMLALTMAPIVDCLDGSRILRRLPRALRRGTAATLVFLALAVLLALLTVLIVRPLVAEINEFVKNWPLFRAEWSARLDWLQERYATLPVEIRAWIEQHGFKDLGAGVGPQIQNLAQGTLSSGMLIVELILIPVLAFSFLTEGRPLKREFCALLPRARVRDGLYLVRQTGIILQSYAVGQLILALIAGIVVYLLMVLFGIRYALAMAVVAAITRVIPVIGPIIGGIPIVLISSLQGWEKGLAVLIAFTVMHLVESKIIMPSLIGYRIKLHPAIVIVALLVGAEFFGMWGMFLAAPVAAVARLFIHHFYVRPFRRGAASAAASSPQKEVELERPAIAGVRSHSGAH